MSSLVVVRDYYLNNGGVINGAIFICAVVSLYRGLERFLHYRRLMGSIRNGSLAPEEIFIERVTLSKGLETMMVWISAAPLLGLLGTVVGMISTFDTITNYGNSNPVFLTEGISLALHTTQAGLLVSIPIMLFYNSLVQKRDRLFELLSTSKTV